MQNDHQVLIDMRWREQGWLEAFRLRLTGWLPANEAERGFSCGVIERLGSEAGCQVVLTHKGSDLTEPAEASMSDESCRLLVSILHLHGFNSTTFNANARCKVLTLNRKSQFSGPFKEKIVSFFEDEANSAPEIRTQT